MDMNVTDTGIRVSPVWSTFNVKLLAYLPYQNKMLTAAQ